MMSTARKSWIRRLMVVVVTLALVDQLLLYTVLRDGVFFGHDVAPFAQPLFSPQQRDMLARFEELLAEDRAKFDARTQFDAELGWCPPRGGRREKMAFDWAGSRMGIAPLPRNRGAGERLIALVGCSFTLGSEVRDDESWAYGLDARLPGTRVGNFGVGGYGADQTLLRYRRDVAPLAPDEVWFGFFPGATLRVSSHFPPLVHRWRARTVLFKPMFTREQDGTLTLHPSPARTPEDVGRLLHDRAAFMDALAEHDAWIGRARPAYMEQGAHWSHHSALGRVLLTLHERGGRSASDALSDTNSSIYRLNRELILTLAREVVSNGARFRVLILPGGLELEEAREQGGGYWQPLVDALRLEGVEVLDLSHALLEAGVTQGDTYWMPGGHYSARTNAIVAGAIDAAWGQPAD